MGDQHKDAPDYFENRWGLLKQRERRWFVLLSASTLCGLLLAAGLFMLIPLKEVRLKVLEVNTLTGQTQVMGGLDPALFQNEPIKQNLTWRYVRNRLTYDSATAYEDAAKVILFSHPSILREYKKEVDPNEPTSPAAVWGEKSKRRVRLVSVVLEGEDLARVRFETQITHNGSISQPTPYTARIKFRFTATPAEELHSIENPFGFQVLPWRLDREIIGD